MGQQLTIRESAESFVAPITETITGVLPSTLTVERFKAAIVAAIVHNPNIMQCDPTSIRSALLKCASDGLVPDNKQAALVPFNEKIKGKNGAPDRWVKKAQYIPMVQGIIQRAKELGELREIVCEVVFEHDEFEHEYGDNGFIRHKAPKLGDNRGNPIGVYAIFKDITGRVVHREVMSEKQVNQVRNVSKLKDGIPWKNWTDEMWRKTVIRRGVKYVPLSAAMQEIIQRDDEYVDLNQKSQPDAGYNPLIHDDVQAVEHDQSADDDEQDDGADSDENVIDVAEESTSSSRSKSLDEVVADAKEAARAGREPTPPADLDDKFQQVWLTAYDDEFAAMEQESGVGA